MRYFTAPARILPAALPAVLRGTPAMWSKIAPRPPGQARPRLPPAPSTPGFLKLNGRIHPVSDDDARALLAHFDLGEFISLRGSRQV